MSDVRKEELVRLSAKRELTPEEESRLEAWFAAHPEARGVWDEERAISRAVQSLPDVPVSSNFTARVLEQIDFDARKEQRRARQWFRLLWPRLGWATALLLAALLAWQHRVVKQERLMADLADVSDELTRVAQLPELDALQDFDVINRLSEATPSDDELLAALQ